MRTRLPPGPRRAEARRQGRSPGPTKTDAAHYTRFVRREWANFEIGVEVVIEGDAEIGRHDRVVAGMRAGYSEQPLRADRPDTEGWVSIVSAQPAVDDE